jgi:uncharacterized protein YxjI
MAFCTSCGKQIDSNAAFCPSCGRPTGFHSSASQGASPFNAPASTPSDTSVGYSLLESNDILMKKQIISLTEHYNFEDPQGNRLGEGDGNFFQLPAKFRILDTSGTEVMHMDGKLISLRKQFTFFDSSGNELGVIKKKLVKLFGDEYWVEQNGKEFLRIYGNFVEHDYKFEVNKQLVAQVHKRWVALRDTFGISITGNVDHRLVIGSAIAVEHEEVTERKR